MRCSACLVMSMVATPPQQTAVTDGSNTHMIQHTHMIHTHDDYSGKAAIGSGIR